MPTSEPDKRLRAELAAELGWHSTDLDDDSIARYRADAARKKTDRDPAMKWAHRRRLDACVHTHDDFAWTSPEELEVLAQQDVPWRYYLDTAVYLESADRRGTVTPVSGAGGDRPPLGPCHVIAAVQPDSEPDSEENLARLEVLDRELQAAAIASIRATGTSIEGNHREEGRAVFGLDDAAACILGRRFGQVAVFSWQGPKWSLLACSGERHTHRAWQWEPGAAT
ncbi:MAG: hypothetical protein QOF25_1174 [Mycobacterium sp.]|nr:hypothetical protein [Mycobacterium sp.]